MIRARFVMWALDWLFIVLVIINDFISLLPSVLFFVFIAYLLYRLSYEIALPLFEILCGQGAFSAISTSRHLFAIYVVILFSSIVLGSPPELGFPSNPTFLPITFPSSLFVGGLIFTYFLAREMLRQTDLPKLAGPIPGFWRRVGKIGKKEDFIEEWKMTHKMAPGTERKLVRVMWIYGPAFSLVFVALIAVWLFASLLYFSWLLDGILVVWLICSFLSRFGLASLFRNLKADTEKTVSKSLLSGYSRFGPKTMFVSIFLMSNLLGIVVNAQPFVRTCLQFPSALGERTHLAFSFVLLLFAPLVSYQLYFWWLLVRRSSFFLAVWHSRRQSVRKAKTLPRWAIMLFLATWFPLIIQEFLLGPHFYPYKGNLSLDFMFSLHLNDFLPVAVLALISAAHAIGLLKMAKRRETSVTSNEILHDNFLYGLVSIAVWMSAAFITALTQTTSTELVLILLYITLISTYFPDVAQLIEQRLRKPSWLRSICYIGYPTFNVALVFYLVAALSIYDKFSAYTLITALFALFLFFVWLDVKWTEFESTQTRKQRLPMRARKTLGLISCTKSKRDYPCKASEMYQASDLFRKAYSYATRKYDFVVILSAKYGLLFPDDKIEPYNLTLNDMKSQQRKKWAEKVFSQMKSRLGLQEFDKVFFHAGKKYREHLIPELENLGIDCEAPLENLGIGKQKAWYIERSSW